MLIGGPTRPPACDPMLCPHRGRPTAGGRTGYCSGKSSRCATCRTRTSPAVARLSPSWTSAAGPLPPLSLRADESCMDEPCVAAGPRAPARPSPPPYPFPTPFLSLFTLHRLLSPPVLGVLQSSLAGGRVVRGRVMHRWAMHGWAVHEWVMHGGLYRTPLVVPSFGPPVVPSLVHCWSELDAARRGVPPRPPPPTPFGLWWCGRNA